MIQEIINGSVQVPDTIVVRKTSNKMRESIETMESWGGTHSTIGVPLTLHKYVQNTLGNWQLLDYEYIQGDLYVLAGKGEDTDPYLADKVRQARDKVKENVPAKRNPFPQQVVLPNVVAPSWNPPKIDISPDFITEIPKSKEDAGSEDI